MLKNCSKLIIAASFFGASNSAFAGCEDILRYINYDTNRNYSSLTSEQINDASFCSADYRSASKSERAQIEASYKLFSGSAGADSQQIETTQSTRCGSKFGSAFLQTIGVAETNIVSARAVSALEACYNSAALQLVGLSTSPNYFLATFRWNGNGAIRVAGFDVSKLANGTTPVANCRIGANGLLTVPNGFTLRAGQVATLACDRVAQTRQVADGTTLIEYPEGQVALVTNASSISIPLVRVADWTSPIQRISQLESKVQELKTADTALHQEIGAIRQTGAETAQRLSRGRVVLGPTGGANDTPGFDVGTCPAGQVAVAFKTNNRDWALDYFYCAELKFEAQ
jgi:hypothetical protein